MNTATEYGLKDPDLDKMIIATQKLQAQAKQNQYAGIRNEREKATFAMMMRMNPEALTEIRKEFFARRDAITLDEFMYIMNKHLLNRKGDDAFVMETAEKREFGLNLYELFKDIDINGDGNLEWQEFTSFTVEKANLLNKRAKLTSIPHYHDSASSLDPSAKYRHRHDIAKFVNLPSLGQFAIVEDHKNAIFVFNSRYGRHLATINTEAAPIGITSIPDKDREYLVASGADMTLSTFSLDDPNPKRRYKALSTWATPGVQMALTYSNDNHLLYSGATNGNIYSWNVQKRSLVNTLTGHTDIVMNLIMLQKLNNIASASLDKTLGIWDSHTNQEILRLLGHKKGVFDLSYSPDYRLLFSCGFEHDACVWSPFVKSLVYRLKGHHACLVGVQSVPNSPEIITADTSGVFKLWDIRNFQCVQTFSANLSGQDTKDSSRLTCFFHTKLPSTNVHQKEDDSRIFAASKLLFSFDQARVVHEATTDYSNVFWVTYNPNSLTIITASERNVIVWDALLGSRLYTHNDICGEEISACCLDDRRRKILLGDVKGKIGVYNCANGQLMKTTHFENPSVVISIEYHDEGKCFVAGFQNGLTCIFDENDMEDCSVIRSFEHFNRHQELLTAKFDQRSATVATAGGSTNIARLWNYHSGKCDTELCLGHSQNIIIMDLILLHPYPLVLTSDTTGNIILWGSRGTRWQGLRIAGFLNATPGYADYEKRIRHADEEEDTTPLRALPPALPHRKNLKRENTEKENTTKPIPTRQRGLRLSFNPLSEAFRVDPVLKATSEASARELFAESESKWGKVAPAQTMCWDAENSRVYTGDELGNIRCFDLFDVFQDLRVDTLLDDSSKHRILGLCRGRQRNNQAALPPMFEENISDEFDAAGTHYLLGHPGNAMSYLGVQFIWSFLGHHDRIITCFVVPTLGLLTSGADRLVKMWSFDGKPLGVLLQSVPVGTKSRSWELNFDVDKIIKQENDALDEIIESAQAVANDPDKPDINTLDFLQMQAGQESADFSQSELRQRIEKSAKILGLDFPRQDKKYSHMGIYKPDDSQTIGEQSTASSATGKSLIEALKEIKSTDSAVDYELKTKQMTIIQQKRKAHKLMSISKDYEAKTGVKVKLSAPTNHGNHHGGHHHNHNEGNDDDEEKSRAELDKLLTATSHFAVLAKQAQKQRQLLEEQREQSSLPPQPPLTPGGGMPGLTPLEEPSMNSSQELTDGNSFSRAPSIRQTPITRRMTNVKSKIMDSIKDAQNRGPRTISMIQSCRKYTSYGALDEAIAAGASNSTAGIINGLNSTDNSVLIHAPSAEDLAEIRANREKKHKELLAGLILNSGSSTRETMNSHRTPKISILPKVATIHEESSLNNQKQQGSITTASTGKIGEKSSSLMEDSLELKSEGNDDLTPGNNNNNNGSISGNNSKGPLLKQSSATISVESIPSQD